MLPQVPPGHGSAGDGFEAQQRDLLNTNYFHLVFTVPHELNPLAPDFSEAVSSICCSMPVRRPCSKWLPIQNGSAQEIGFLSILHTWSQTLLGHYHVHCVLVPDAADCPPIIRDGFPPATRCSCCPFRYCTTSSARSSLPDFASSTTAKTSSIAAVPPLISAIPAGSNNWSRK